MRSRTLLLVLSVLLAVGGAQAKGGNGPEALRVLFVGNSLTATNDLPAVVAALAKSFSQFRGRVPHDHTGWGEPRGPLGRRGRRRRARHRRVGRSRHAAGNSASLPESQVDLRKWAVRFAHGARAHQVRPALLTVWPETQRSYALPAVIRSYRRTARAARAELYPAGRAWQAAWRRNPRLPLYGADGFHPSPARHVPDRHRGAGGSHARAADQPAVSDQPARLPAERLPAARAKLLRDAAAEALEVGR